MSSVVISGDTSGTVSLTVPAVAGTNTVTIPASTGTIALTSDVIGLNQTWTDVTASRALATTYTNSTGKPIFVSIIISQGAVNAVASLTISGVVVSYYYQAASVSGGLLCGIVPNGGTYSTATTGPSPGILSWKELR